MDAFSARTDAALLKEPVSVRPCTDSEREVWKQFLDANFSYQAPESYTIDFAPLFESENLKNSLLLWQGNRLLASASLYRVGTFGVIGAVATDPNHRSRGLSRHLIESLEHQARSQGLTGLVLWSDKLDFYARMGFTPQGNQQIWTLNELEPPKVALEGKVENRWSIPEVSNLHLLQPMRFSRTEKQWEWIAKITSVERRQWVDSKQRVLAYLAFGRGKDLQNVVHEWGGEPKALHQLLFNVAQESKDTLFWLSHPKIKDPITAGFSPYSLIQETHLCLAKAFQPTDFSRVWFWGLDSM